MRAGEECRQEGCYGILEDAGWVDIEYSYDGGIVGGEKTIRLLRCKRCSGMTARLDI